MVWMRSRSVRLLLAVVVLVLGVWPFGGDTAGAPAARTSSCPRAATRLGVIAFTARGRLQKVDLARCQVTVVAAAGAVRYRVSAPMGGGWLTVAGRQWWCCPRAAGAWRGRRWDGGWWRGRGRRGPRAASSCTRSPVAGRCWRRRRVALPGSWPGGSPFWAACPTPARSGSRPTVRSPRWICLVAGERWANSTRSICAPGAHGRAPARRSVLHLGRVVARRPLALVLDGHDVLGVTGGGRLATRGCAGGRRGAGPGGRAHAPL